MKHVRKGDKGGGGGALYLGKEVTFLGGRELPGGKKRGMRQPPVEENSVLGGRVHLKGKERRNLRRERGQSIHGEKRFFRVKNVEGCKIYFLSLRGDTEEKGRAKNQKKSSETGCR